MENAIAPGDYPRVRVYPGKFRPNTQANSSGSQLTTIWDIQVCTGDQNLGTFCVVVWAIFRACASWATYLQAGTSWDGDVYIASVKPVEVYTQEPSRPGALPYYKKAADRGTRQWITVYSLAVDMWFATPAIQGT